MRKKHKPTEKEYKAGGMIFFGGLLTIWGFLIYGQWLGVVPDFPLTAYFFVVFGLITFVLGSMKAFE